MHPFPFIYTLLGELPKTTLIGEVRVPGPNKHFLRIPDEWILYIISDGTMIIREEEQEYTLTGGDILILSPGKCHFGIPVKDRVHYYYVHFRWDSLKDLTLTPTEFQKRKKSIQEESILMTEESPMPDHLLLPKHFHPVSPVYQEIEESTRSLLHSSRSMLPHQQNINDCTFLLTLLKLSQSEIIHTLPASSRTLSSILPVIAYLKEHHREKISGRLLEQNFHLSFDYMNRKFKENTGVTIFQFLEKYRVEQSKRLLESKRFSITEIAESLGFCNAFYFTKVFKKLENMTPSEYKKRH